MPDGLLSEAQLHALSGLTPEGRAFAHHYVHPPGAVPTEFRGYPDRDISDSVSVQDRFDVQVSTPSAGGTWECMVIINCNPSVPLITLRRKTGATNWNSADMKWHKSTFCKTFYENLTGKDRYDLNDTSLYFSGVRTVARSATCYLNASAMYDAGMCYSAQFAKTYSHVDNVATSTGADHSFKSSKFGCLFDTNQDHTRSIMSASPKSVSHLAKEGSFLPIEFGQPDNPFCKVDTMNIVPFVAYIEGDGSVSNYTLNFDETIGRPAVSSSPVCNLPFPEDNMRCGVSYFVGLHESATLAVKLTQTLECCPSVGSPYSFFSHQSPHPDYAAIDVAAIIRNEFPDALPASANDWGSVWDGLKRIGSSILNVVKSPLLDTVAATHPVARAALMGIRTFGSLIGDKESPVVKTVPKAEPKPKKRQQKTTIVTKARPTPVPKPRPAPRQK